MEGNSYKNTLRRARVGYAAIVVFGLAGELIRQSLIVKGDPVLSVLNIKENEILFRISFVSDLIMLTCFLLTGQAFYDLFKDTNESRATHLRLFVNASVPLHMANMLSQFATILVLDGRMSSFSDAQVTDLAMLFQSFQFYGYQIAQIFFGLWLIPLGLLAIEINGLPKILGRLPILAGISMLAHTVLIFVIPGVYELVATAIESISALGELAFVAYFLFKGLNISSISK